eukprot:TRINITY_DN5270_c0_g2_i3.p1 TRINITY_DN5270_c0_g2~~TRINITY_DN5270_c0_g2_i3.p1  ORF type:complete len:1456 (-),score=501.24 TRINITY_DN5270_c0_g2_i3:3-4370(-)
MTSKSLQLLSGLKTDLTNLSNEAKKKFPTVKEAVDKCLGRIKELEEQKGFQDEQRLEAISTSEDILRPFLLSCDSKNPKMTILAVNTIHKLTVHNAIALTSMSEIIQKFSTLAPTAEEPIQLKVLQGLLALVSTQTIHGKDLSLIIITCFRLQGNRVASVNNTAAATMRQLVTILFDRASMEYRYIPEEDKKKRALEVDDSKETIVPKTLYPSASDAYLLILDICNLTGGDPPIWLIGLDSYSKPFGLELIDSVLVSHTHIFTEIPEFGILLKDRVCPLIIKTYKLQTDFPCIIRLVRILHSFIKNFHASFESESEVFLSKLMKMLDPHNPLWMQTLSLEVLKSLCENTSVMKSLFQSYDMAHDHKTGKIFKLVVEAIGQFADSMFNWESLVISRQNLAKPRYLDLTHAVEPAVVNESYVVCVVIDCLIGITNAIAKTTESGATNEDDRKLAVAMITSSSQVLLSSFSLLLEKATDEPIIQDLLKAYFTLINCCATLGQSGPRDELLNSLCKFTTPRNNDISTPLTSKNVFAMKTLLNIAHERGNVLNEGWAVVLETFRQLDRILNTPHKLQLSTGLQVENVAENLNIPSPASLDLLFKSSKTLDNSALVFLMSALRKISTDAIQQPGQNRVLFGAGKMVETAKFNVHRIGIFWEIVLDHFTLLINNKDPNIRNFGADALTQVIALALAKKGSAHPEELSPEMKERNDVVPGERTALDMQTEFLETLETLAKSQFPEVREKSLQTLYQILQSTGQDLTKAWPLVLSLIMTTAVNGDRHHIPIAFKSAQLICSDFLSNLAVDCLALYIHTAGCYGIQTADLNISLTAINLLMGIADFIATQTPVSKDSPRDVITNDPQSLSFAPLWASVFGEMKLLGSDARYEVRNCASQTLFKTITTHGGLLKDPTWQVCVENIMFPLLDAVRASVSSASDEEIGEDSENFRMLVHHTRNTASKQWHESLVLTLSGVVRVFKTYFFILKTLPNFEENWRKLWEQMVISATQPVAEISISAIGLMQELLLAHGSNPQFSKTLWDISWNHVEKMSLVIMEKGSTIPPQTLNALAKSLPILYEKFQPQFTSEDWRRLLRILRPLLLYPPEIEGQISFIQESVMSLLKSMPIQDEIFPAVMVELLSYISFSIGYTYKNKITEEPSYGYSLTKSYLPLAIPMVLQVENLFKDATPKLKTLVFEDVITVLGAAMMTKFSSYNSHLWIDSVENFIRVVTVGLDPISASEFSDLKFNLIWTELVDSIEGFIFQVERRNVPMGTPEIVKRDENLDVALVRLLAREMITKSEKVPLMHERMIDVLLEGTKLANQNREVVSEASYNNLFALASVDPNLPGDIDFKMKIAKMACPKMMHRCREVLVQFIEADRESGSLPVARSLLAEVSFMLTQLSQLEWHPDIEDDTLAPGKKGGKKRHLLKLFPLLCDCITTKEMAIKPILQELFHAAGREIGLE